MLARVFFGMNVESSYFKKVKNGRLEKLKMLVLIEQRFLNILNRLIVKRY
jgi:hypothetical protein